MKEWAEWFYKGKQWLEVEPAFLKSKGYICERCLRQGEVVAAKIAHHKIYLTKQNIYDPAIAYAWDNLEALCQTCHNKEHHKRKDLRYRIDAEGNLIPPLFPLKIGGVTYRGGEIKKTLQGTRATV